MILLSFIGLLLSLLGIISLAIGFRIEKTRAEEPGNEFYIEDKLPIVLHYENPFLRRAGWFLVILGYILQMISLF